MTTVPPDPVPATNASGRANRLAPDGSFHTSPARGQWWGNRGSLLDADGSLHRHWAVQRWITCTLDYKGIRRDQWRPGRLTELYVLDEPTSLATGHRPCSLCRHPDFVRYVTAWRRAFDEPDAKVPDIDERLHADRLAETARPRQLDAAHRTYAAGRDDLPDGTMVNHEHGWWLLRGGAAYAWSFDGYTDRRPRASLPDRVKVQTPRASVAVLAAGYELIWHPSLSTTTARES